MRGSSSKKSSHTDWVIVAEDETEPVNLVLVERVGVEHTEIHFPLFKVVGVN